jgi:hypothetical protein
MNKPIDFKGLEIEYTYTFNHSTLWKQSLLALLDLSNSLSVPELEVEVFKHCVTESKLTFMGIYKYIETSGYDVEIKKQLKSHKDIKTLSKKDKEILYCELALEAACNSMIHLKKSGYVYQLEVEQTIYEDQQPKLITRRDFGLTEKGIDVALKLQEHIDNQKRHITTVSYSKKAFGVSVGALIAAIISAYFNFQRLDLYQKQVVEIAENQSTILEKVEVPKVIQE